METTTQTAVLGGGCFWCTEAVFQQVRGVVSVVSGYAGGEMSNPKYEQVTTGSSGHAEVIKIEFDPAQITYRDLLEVFFAVHDPTTVNQQGNDVGEQYRSIILYTSDEQKQQAEKIIKELVDDHAYENSIVTTIKPLEKFYEAEDYHQNYFTSNPNQPYCQLIINPKLKKFKEKFATLLKVA